jgi:excisionase family DNA binding protein
LQEALQILRISRTTLYRWIREGRIRAMKAGRQWRFKRDDIERFLGGEKPRVSLPVSPAPLVNALKDALQAAGTPPSKQAFEAQDPIEQGIYLLCQLARCSKASDIHIAPYMDNGCVTAPIRLRIDGVLHKVADLDPRLLPHFMERFKGMAGCDVLETMRPQDGRILFTLPDGDHYDLRVCFLPLGLGTSVTVRLLSALAGGSLVDLDHIAFAPADRERIDRAIALPHGIIVFTGPTGSGKSTSVYAALSCLAKPENKVVSVEDPIEYQMPWVDQVQVNTAAGLSFSRALRAIFRSDPDVVCCGEIRDLETLQLCVQAALTGHLVFTVLHTDDAVRGLQRMMDMGPEPFLVGDAVKLIVAQRLVRLLCSECARGYTPSANQLEWAKLALTESHVREDEIPRQFREPMGCPACAHSSGYRGRNVVAETLVMTAQIAQGLKDGAAAEDLRRLAVAGGMTTMAADAARKAYAGTTSLQEAYRVTGVKPI